MLLLACLCVRYAPSQLGPQDRAEQTPHLLSDGEGPAIIYNKIILCDFSVPELHTGI